MRNCDDVIDTPRCRIEPSLADYAWTDTPSATTWTNWLYVLYPALSKGKNRTINFSRYGGLGNHRTPTGFSGDTKRRWDTLEYQVYFTPRASNVGFGWWSHDIGGFDGDFVDTDWYGHEFVYLRTWGGTDDFPTPRRGAETPHQRPLSRLHSTFMEFMLTCVFPMTHNDEGIRKSQNCSCVGCSSGPSLRL